MMHEVSSGDQYIRSLNIGRRLCGIYIRSQLGLSSDNFYMLIEVEWQGVGYIG